MIAPSSESLSGSQVPDDSDSGLAPQPARVLYIGGVGRSGSTVLERVLGEISGLCGVGELVHLWSRGLVANELCGCGEPFRACEFWGAVGRTAFGGWDQVDGLELAALKASVDRHRYLPLMLRPQADPAYATRLGRMAEILRSLYGAIAHVSGDVIVDSSKTPSYLFLLRRVEGIDLRLLHLVRDSRGVAYSTLKRVRRPETQAREEFMPTYRPSRAAFDYLAYNSLLDVIGLTRIPSMHLRYERFVTDPRGQTERVLRFARVASTAGGLDFIGPDSARLAPIHSVSGNPMRFVSGDVPIQLDEEWRTGLAPKDRAAVSLITSPLLRRYGYEIRS